ncbi:MAG TPA: formimidoylglutamate deiminase [Anaeromyxobacter sp.]|nr:formimidoylglutamate deiminase [Anaeromyxobacter sp.]
MASTRAFAPDLLLAAGALRAGAALSVLDGTVAAVGAPLPGAELVRLPGRALLPGLVSAHGHAFQRVLRGRAERAPGARSFWSWRELMYRAASRLSPDDLEAVSRFAFHELARAGVTCAGEFHYLHRDPEGRPYADPAELELRVVRAARDVGIRIVLLRAAYARAGFGLPPEPAQRRFVEPSPDAYLAALDRLVAGVRGDPLASIGVAPHSVRACPAEWLRALADEARRRALPLHVHAAEQPAELDACRLEHGVSPVRLLEREGALGSSTTVVHAIHVDDADVRAIGAARATVCACPTTERNLADGIVPADRLLDAGARLALGVDSHAGADLLEEARAVELDLRLVRQERGILDDPPGSLAERLFAAASAGGMASLGLAGGRLAPGEPADFVLVDLDDPSVAATAPEDLVAALVFGGSVRAIRSTYVAGEAVIEDGRGAGRVDGRRVTAEFREALGRIWAEG